MKEKALSFRDMEKKTGITISQLHGMATGKWNNITLKTLVKLVKAYPEYNEEICDGVGIEGKVKL